MFGYGNVRGLCLMEEEENTIISYGDGMMS